MTVPVARTQVRRNVRMAVALVVGQAVLCVVIGYIALGGLGGHPGLTPQAVGPLAAPTGEDGGPSVTSRPPSKPGQPSPRGIPVLPDTIAAPPGPVKAPQILDAPGAEPAAVTTDPTVAATSPATSGTGTGTGTGSPTPTDDQGAAAPQNKSVQPNAVLGGPCDKAHQSGTTSDGVDVVCLPDAQGDLTWQLPKQPPGQQK